MLLSPYRHVEGEHLALMSSIEFARHTARWLGVACSWRGYVTLDAVVVCNITIFLCSVWTVEGFGRSLRTVKSQSAQFDSDTAVTTSYDVTFDVDDDERRLRVYDASGDLGAGLIICVCE